MISMTADALDELAVKAKILTKLKRIVPNDALRHHLTIFTGGACAAPVVKLDRDLAIAALNAQIDRLETELMEAGFKVV